jgi:hypothetical protein
MAKYLVSVGLIFALMLGGILVQRLCRGFARRHPELGPFREERSCGSCSAGRGCGTARCAPSRRD